MSGDTQEPAGGTDLARYWEERLGKQQHDRSGNAGQGDTRQQNAIEIAQEMTYEEFIQGRRAGTIRVGIDESSALRLIDHLPKRYQAAHMFWSWVWMLSIPGFICLSIFWRWWAGLLLLFLVTPMIFRATNKSAAQFVLEHAQANKEFFDKLVANKLLVFKDNS